MVGAVGGRLDYNGQESCRRWQLADLIGSTKRSVSGCVSDFELLKSLPEWYPLHNAPHSSRLISYPILLAQVIFASTRFQSSLGGHDFEMKCQLDDLVQLVVGD